MHLRRPETGFVRVSAPFRRSAGRGVTFADDMFGFEYFVATKRESSRCSWPRHAICHRRTVGTSFSLDYYDNVGVVSGRTSGVAARSSRIGSIRFEPAPAWKLSKARTSSGAQCGPRCSILAQEAGPRQEGRRQRVDRPRWWCAAGGPGMETVTAGCAMVYFKRSRALYQTSSFIASLVPRRGFVVARLREKAGAALAERHVDGVRGDTLVARDLQDVLRAFVLDEQSTRWKSSRRSCWYFLRYIDPHNERARRPRQVEVLAAVDLSSAANMRSPPPAGGSGTRCCSDRAAFLPCARARSSGW